MMLSDRVSAGARSDPTAGPAAPRVSLVITWPDESARLEEMLAQRLPHGLSAADTIVVTGLPVDEQLVAAYPNVRFIVAPADCSPARMRALGLRQATGDVVLLLGESDVEPALADRAPVTEPRQRVVSA